ncbi:MAG: Cell division protein FtsH (EC, partial [uncultured Sulfurovum sp.]
MKYLINFIEAKNVSKTKIFPHLKCSRQEAKILQYICRRFVKGIEETAVLDILQDNFEYESYDYLNYLSIIKKLMDMGWIVQISFGQVKVQEVSQLEVLNTSVAPTMSLLRLLEEGS